MGLLNDYINGNNIRVLVILIWHVSHNKFGKSFARSFKNMSRSLEKISWTRRISTIILKNLMRLSKPVSQQPNIPKFQQRLIKWLFPKRELCKVKKIGRAHV